VANLCITSVCNQRCDYCFARNGPSDGGVPFMPWDRFVIALDLVQRSGLKEARLLGGEPTLHPEFPRMVAEVVSRDMKLLVFTNGQAPEAALKALEAHASSVTALLNVSFSDDFTVPDVRPQQDFLRRLRERVCLGVNLYTTRIRSLSLLLDWINTYGLARSVRLGLAHGRIGTQNQWLRPKQYHMVAPAILEFAIAARASAVELSFDCGFVPCMFSSEAGQRLREMGIQLRSSCEPVLDILPTGEIAHCYPLADLHREHLTAGMNRQMLRDRFQARFAANRRATIFKECAACAALQASECTGGCLAASLSRLHCRQDAAAFAVHAPTFVSPLISSGATSNTVAGFEGAPNA
jgi:sulfatase maturation enzyme AslB (radical SAM superfamily)